MGTKKRVNKYPRAFKLMAMERMKKCENVSELAKELGIERTVLYHLKMIEGGAAGGPPFRDAAVVPHPFALFAKGWAMGDTPSEMKPQGKKTSFQ